MLSGNRLTGAIPDNLSALTHLTYVGLNLPLKQPFAATQLDTYPLTYLEHGWASP
jgi:hypothetical protein